MLSREKPATERAWKFVMSCGYQPGGARERERESCGGRRRRRSRRGGEERKKRVGRVEWN